VIGRAFDTLAKILIGYFALCIATILVAMLAHSLLN